MAPGDLQEVLAGLRPAGRATPPDLLVRLPPPRDSPPAAAIAEPLAFSPPVVDDPWTWGAVAAANAMSDVYAMGGEVLFALAIAGFPRELPKAIIADVFRGGSDKVAEAGGVLAGGHTVGDTEPKYGLCVTGRVHPDRLLLKGALRPGDRVFLSKPLGTGVIATAGKDGHAPADVLSGAGAGMPPRKPPPPRGGRGRRAPRRRRTSRTSASSSTRARWWRPRARGSRSPPGACRCSPAPGRS